jgi:hypothetical protein
MKYKTVTVREGEYLGSVDWNYDFMSHFKDYCCDKELHCEEAVAKLKILAENPDKYQATVDGGIPRVGWGDVVQVGMYDGWPYWRPVPSVCIKTWTGGHEWHSFDSITDIREKSQAGDW